MKITAMERGLILALFNPALTTTTIEVNRTPHLLLN